VKSESVRRTGGSEGRVRETRVKQVEGEFWVGWIDGRHRKRDSKSASARVIEERFLEASS